MKALIAAVILLTTFNVFAGPEDHIANQTCYRLNQKQAALANNNIPQQICLETLTVNTDGTEIRAYSYFTPNLFNNLKLTYHARRNENGFSFRSDNILVNQWESGCGDGERVVLSIKGQTDNDGVASVEYLDVKVSQELTNDVCHSQPQETVFTYDIY